MFRVLPQCVLRNLHCSSGVVNHSQLSRTLQIVNVLETALQMAVRKTQMELSHVSDLLPPTKEEVNDFACARLSVCLLTRLFKNACMDLDVGTWTNWLTFEPDPDYSLAAGTGLLSPILYKGWYTEFNVGKITRTCIGGVVFGASRGFKMVLLAEASDNLCRRYMSSTECPSSLVLPLESEVH